MNVYINCRIYKYVKYIHERCYEYAIERYIEIDLELYQATHTWPDNGLMACLLFPINLKASTSKLKLISSRRFSPSHPFSVFPMSFFIVKLRRCLKGRSKYDLTGTPCPSTFPARDQEEGPHIHHTEYTNATQSWSQEAHPSVYPGSTFPICIQKLILYCEHGRGLKQKLCFSNNDKIPYHIYYVACM